MPLWNTLEEEDLPPVYETGNRWYFFVPPVMVGIWTLVAIARVVAYVVVPGGIAGGAASEAAAEDLGRVFDVVDGLGGIGWVLLFIFYFVVLSRKRASAWWALGGLCCGVNLLLYVALLFVPARRYMMTAPAPAEPRPLGSGEPRRSASMLKDSFVCESCDALLNYGVSECRGCGARYRYVDGEPVMNDEIG